MDKPKQVSKFFMDQRIVKTNNALSEALFHLMETKLIENITVNEVCKKANVRRATFYQHFNDKYDLFAFMAYRTRVEFFSYNMENITDITFFIQTLAGRCFHVFDKYRKLVKNNAISTSFLLLENIFTAELSEAIKEKITQLKTLSLITGNIDFLTNAYTGCLVQIIKWWFKDDTKETDKEIIDQLGIFLSNK